MSDDLDNNIRDRIVALSKGVSSAIPYAGGFVGELLAQIPNQRVDRIVVFVRQLSERLASLEQTRQQEILSNPDRVEFVEEGGRQAARATSAERIPKIVSAVVRGLTSEETDLVRRKRLLNLLGQIDEDEMLLLSIYGDAHAGDYDAWNRIDRPPPPHLDSTTSDLDNDKLFELGRENLLRLGLIEKRYSSSPSRQERQFDARTGDFKHRKEISYLGRMLLREVGTPAAIDLNRTNEVPRSRLNRTENR